MEKTKEEISKMITNLEKLRKKLPHHNFFGDDNWGLIDAQLSILKEEKTYDDYENEEYNIESAANNIKEWMEGSLADEEIIDTDDLE